MDPSRSGVLITVEPTCSPMRTSWYGAAAVLRPSAPHVHDRPQVEEMGRQQLVVPAFGRALVGAPAQEAGGVAEAVALQMVECNLADQLGAHGHPVRLAPPRPSRRPPRRPPRTEGGAALQ